MTSAKSPKTFGIGPLLRGLSLLLTGGSMMLVALLLLGMWRSGDRFLASVMGWFNSANSQPQIDVRSVVVKQVQDASELTTAIFTMEAVVPTQQNATLGGFVVGTTKLLYVAYGQVRAGVDLSQIKASDIQVQADASGSRLVVRLPAPKLLDSKIDVSRSQVYDYNRGFLGLGPDAAPTLQTMAQQQALDKIVAAACQEGILAKAGDRAKLVVSQLVKIPPYKEVVIEMTPPGACQTAVTATTPATTPAVAPVPSDARN